MPYKNKAIFASVIFLVAISIMSVGCGGGSRANTLASGAGPTPNPTPAPIPNPAPKIVAISPNEVLVRGADFSVTVNGSNFLSSSVVRLNGSSRGTTFVSASQLTAQIAASDIDKTGQAAITVFNPLPGGGMSNSLTLTILPAVAFGSARALDGTDARNTNGITNIWVVDGFGATPLTKLTAVNASSFGAGWSPDGNRIVFSSNRALDGTNAMNTNATTNVWEMNSDGSGAFPLTKLTALSSGSAEAMWSPDGSKIVFTSAGALDGTDATNGTANIWLVNANGSGAATPLTRLKAANANNIAPVWSPDGSKILFTATRLLDTTDGESKNDDLNVWVMNADGTGVKPLTTYTASGAGAGAEDGFSPPVWSPNGMKIAFVSNGALDGSDNPNPAGTGNIWVMNADGSGATPLTRYTVANATAFLPTWSPDGSKIVFVSSGALNGSNTANANEVDNIWTVNADGSSTTPLTQYTTANLFADSPAWSPDGNKVAFISNGAFDGSNTSNKNGAVNIWIMNSDGSAAIPLTKLTTGNTHSENPQWQP